MEEGQLIQTDGDRTRFIKGGESPVKSHPSSLPRSRFEVSYASSLHMFFLRHQLSFGQAGKK